MTVPRLVHGRRSQHFDCTPRGARSRRVRDGARGGAKCPHLQNRPLQSSAQRNPRPSSCSHLGSKLPPFDMGAQSPASFCNANDLVLAALVASTAVRDAFVGHPTNRIVLTRPVTAGQAPHPRLLGEQLPFLRPQLCWRQQPTLTHRHRRELYGTRPARCTPTDRATSGIGSNGGTSSIRRPFA
ncbi:MAG: hypothetical protein QOJ78_528 [Pseudonocardiales bacterium]|nr:hypothetical protein [Pseudonocardiales bacterium]